MKRTLLILLCYATALSASAQSSKKYDDSDHFILKGSIYEVDHLEETEGKAKEVQVVIFQGDEIYAAFMTNKNMSNYEFYLPINHEYNVFYGGETYVNKIVNIDARQFPSEKKPRTVKLSVGLFKPIQGYGFEMMKDPFVKVKYNPEADTIDPDFEYTGEKSAQIEKYFKKIKKELGKKQKNQKELDSSKSFNS